MTRVSQRQLLVVHLGFSSRRMRRLVEFHIVVVVLGLLVMGALVEHRTSIERARVTEALTLAIVAKEEQTLGYAYAGDWTVPRAHAVLPPGSYRYVESIEHVDGAFTISLPTREREQPWLLTFRPAVNAAVPRAPVYWLCGYQSPPPGYAVPGENKTDIPRAYLPAACRGTS